MTGMSKPVLKELRRLRRIGGSQIHLEVIRGTDNIVIRGQGEPVIKQISGNVSIGAETVIRAKKRLLNKGRK